MAPPPPPSVVVVVFGFDKSGSSVGVKEQVEGSERRTSNPALLFIFSNICEEKTQIELMESQAPLSGFTNIPKYIYCVSICGREEWSGPTGSSPDCGGELQNEKSDLSQQP